MTLRKWIAALLLCFSSFLCAEEPFLLSFKQLEDPDRMITVNNQEVIVRGFLYQGNDGRWMLASEPNLKTCCIASDSKIGQQIMVSGVFPEQAAGRAVALQGRLSIAKGQNKTGKTIGLYLMQNAKLVDKDSGWGAFPMISLSVIGLSLLVAWAVRRRA